MKSKSMAKGTDGKVKMSGAMKAEGHKPSESIAPKAKHSVQKALCAHNSMRQKELTSSSSYKKGKK